MPKSALEPKKRGIIKQIGYKHHRDSELCDIWIKIFTWKYVISHKKKKNCKTQTIVWFQSETER